MMHSIGFSIPSLYVKSAPRTYDIGKFNNLHFLRLKQVPNPIRSQYACLDLPILA